MRDVAALAGVSPKTVSNVVNGGVSVRPETRARVEDAVRRLDYRPNLSARGLRNGRTGAIALAFPDLATPYSAEMVHVFVEVAHDRGWSVQIEQTGTRPEREHDLLYRGKEHLVDGLVLNPVTLDASAIAGADTLPPVVVIGEVEQTLVDQVGVDSVAAARDMTLHLAALGHRRIAVLGPFPPGADTASARARTHGWRLALQEAGLEHDPSLSIEVDEWSSPGAASAVRVLIARGGPLPDAIFCFTDSLAIGALHALAAAGVDVPGDVSVAGFDDVADGRFAVPAITTVSFDKWLFAERTLELLADRVADRQGDPVLVRIPYRIVDRASTAARSR